MYVTEEKLEKKLAEVRDDIKKEIADVKDNHLSELSLKVDNAWGAIEFIMREIKNLRWTVIGWGSVIAIVLAILEVRVD